jgi:Flp pilus assembly protein TadD
MPSKRTTARIILLTAIAAHTIAGEADGLIEARTLLYTGHYPEAAAAYQKLVDQYPKSPEPYTGLVRALIKAHKAQQAYDAADLAIQNASDSAAGQTAAGLATYRKGDLPGAERFFRNALKIDSGYPDALAGLASIYSAVSRHKTARDLLNKAYLRAPADPVLASAHANSLSGPEHIAALERILALLDPDSEAAFNLRTHIANDKAVGDQKLRRLLSPYEAAKVKLILIQNGPHHPRGAGIEMKFNGKYSAKLLIDTGASGISISPKFAEHAGLQSLGEGSEAKGIGDDKALPSFRYIASQISAGKVSFGSFPVAAFRSAKDQDIDGLIGADVFGRFIVGIDYSRMELTLEPRPAPPSEAADEGLQDALAMPEGFHRVYRFGNHLAVPTLLNEKQTRLFMIDSGSTVNLIDQTVAGDLTRIRKDNDTTLRGIQGKVQGVSRADKVTLVFAGFRQVNSDLITIDLTSLSDGMGVGFGGILGMPVLANFKLSIDYLNGAVKMDYINRGR